MKFHHPKCHEFAFTVFCTVLFAGLCLPQVSKAQLLTRNHNRAAIRIPVTVPADPQSDKNAAGIIAPSGVITGIVLADSGRPIANANVALWHRSNRTFRLRGETNEKGQFRFDNLPDGVFSIYVSAAGYYMSRKTPDGLEPVYKPGETATLIMSKGSVITGRVTDANGNPVIGVSVHPTLVRDREGKSVSTSLVRDHQTDDRGIYRLYGLEPGTYIVSVGGNAPFPARTTPALGGTPVYHPSATRDTAVEIVVMPNAEVTGIDITYRDERGHIISGNLIGGLSGSENARASILLVHSKSGTIAAQTAVAISSAKQGFAVNGVADGDYDLLIRANSFPAENASFAVRHIKVKGADVTGLAIPLTRFGAISGNIQIASDTKCKPEHKLAFEEVSLIARHDDISKRKEPTMPIVPTPVSSFADEKGEFALRYLVSGNYWLATQSLHEDWYVKSIAMNIDRPTSASKRSSKTTNDASRTSLMVKPGEQIKGITITVASGAALLQGRVTSNGEKKPLNRIVVHLVPMEPEAADDVLRYIEVAATSDGAFTMKNLAPGRYGVVLRMPDDEEENSTLGKPSAWNQSERLKLRREAEAANYLVTLQPCQRLQEVLVPFTLLSVLPTKSADVKE